MKAKKEKSKRGAKEQEAVKSRKVKGKCKRSSFGMGRTKIAYNVRAWRRGDIPCYVKLGYAADQRYEDENIFYSWALFVSWICRRAMIYR